LAKSNGVPDIPFRTYTLKLDGQLVGHKVVMRAMSGRQLVNIQRGLISESDVLEMIGERCIQHDFGVKDLLDVDEWILEAIMTAWQVAMTEEAVPPQNGVRSPKASPRTPSTPRRVSASR
jgi:hypothetical protein